ncbi:MAG: tyrosine-type recombinase/integrase [Pseudonocardia sp.]
MPRKKRPEGTRNPNGASSIYLGKDGKWHGRVTVGVRPDGRPDRRHIERKTEKEVIAAVRELERHRSQRSVAKAGGQKWTVQTWLTHWLTNIAEPSVRWSTFSYYESAVRLYLTPGLGAHRLAKLEAEHVESLYSRLRNDGHKTGIIHQVHRTLRAATNEALRRGHLFRNPVMLVKVPPLVEVEIEPFTIEQAQKILTAAHGRRNGVRFAIALSLGLRRGEALGLQWRDLNTEAGSLTVRRALQRQKWRHGCSDPNVCGARLHKVKPCPNHCKRHTRTCPPLCPPNCTGHATACPDRKGGGLVVTEVKTRAGRRVLNVPASLLDWLREHDDQQDDERRAAGDVWEDGGWMFAQPNGRALDPRADHDEWKSLLRAASVRDARLHDARHTAATMLLVLGVPARAVMDVMGWSSASMAHRYQHVPDALRQRIAQQLGGLLWGEEHGEEDDGTAGALIPA